MPRRWLHELIDLCTLGKSFWWVHREKDKPWEFLGPDHREVRHRETVEWIVGLFRKAGRMLPQLPPEEFYHDLRKVLEEFTSSEIMEQYREFLKKLPPEANATIQHEAVDEIWSTYDYKTKRFVVNEALKTLFEGKSLWHSIGMEDLRPTENEELKKLREYVQRIMAKEGINGLI